MSIFSDRFEQLKRSDKPVKAPKYLQEVMGFQRISREGIFERQVFQDVPLPGYQLCYGKYGGPDGDFEAVLQNRQCH